MGDVKEEVVETPAQEEKTDKTVENGVEPAVEEEERIWDCPNGSDPAQSKTHQRYRLAVTGLPMDLEKDELYKKVLEIFMENNYGGSGKLAVTPLIRRPLPEETELQMQFVKSDRLKIMLAFKNNRFKGKDYELSIKTVANTQVTDNIVKFLSEVNVEIDTLLDSNLPNRKMPLKEQLDSKKKKGEALVKQMMTGRFKGAPQPRMDPIIPPPMIDSYNIFLVVSIVKDKETGRVESGFKIPYSKMKILVPLDCLISMPKQFVQVAKDFVEFVQGPDGMEICDRENKEGQIGGIILQMSTLGQIVMTLLLRPPPPPAPAEPAEGSEEQDQEQPPPPAEKNLELSEEMVAMVKEKAQKFLEQYPNLPIEEVYAKPLKSMWSKNHMVHKLLGNKVEEPVTSDMGLYVEPSRVWSAPTRSFATLVHTLVQLADLDKHSVVLLGVDEVKYIPFVLAQKCQEVIAFGRWGSAENAKSVGAELRQETRSRELNSKVQVFSGQIPLTLRGKAKGAVLILWETSHNWVDVNKVIMMGVSKVVVACLRLDGLHRVCKELSHFGLIPERVAMVDTQPHTSHFGMVISFVFRPGKMNHGPNLGKMGFGQPVRMMGPGGKRRMDMEMGRGGKMARPGPLGPVRGPMPPYRHPPAWDNRGRNDEPRPLFDNMPMGGPWKGPGQQGMSDPIRQFLENCLVRGLGSLANNPEGAMMAARMNNMPPQQQQNRPWQSGPGGGNFGGGGGWGGDRPEPQPLLPKEMLESDGGDGGMDWGNKGGRRWRSKNWENEDEGRGGGGSGRAPRDSDWSRSGPPSSQAPPAQQSGSWWQKDYRRRDEVGPSGGGGSGTGGGSGWGGGNNKKRGGGEWSDVEGSFARAQGSNLTEKAWGPHNVSMNMKDRYHSLGRSYPPNYNN